MAADVVTSTETFKVGDEQVVIDWMGIVPNTEAKKQQVAVEAITRFGGDDDDPRGRAGVLRVVAQDGILLYPV